MTEDEQVEVAVIITEALMSFRAPTSGDRRLARAHHITQTLAEHGWVLIKEGDPNDTPETG